MYNDPDYAHISPNHIVAGQLVSFAHNIRELSVHLVEELQTLSAYAKRKQIDAPLDEFVEFANECRAQLNKLSQDMVNSAVKCNVAEESDD